MTLTRRGFLRLCGGIPGALAFFRPPTTCLPGLSGVIVGAHSSAPLQRALQQADWRVLLAYYTEATRSNIVTVDGRRALLSSRMYPGTYVRDAVFWGPLALDDPALGFECYQWFAETQLDSGQIRTAVPLHPDEADRLQPQDDEGTLLFILASDWLARAGYAPDEERIARAYGWVQAHVGDHRYISQPGAFRYWADTVSPDTPETIAHNQGLLCLARRALSNMGIGGVTPADIAAAQERYHAFYDAEQGYVTLGKFSRFAAAQDISALFPEFLSRCLYAEPILDDGMALAHVERMIATTSVYYADGRLAGMKVIAPAYGDFLPPEWFFAPGLNQPGDYQNGGYWPLYTLVALALAYAASGDPKYETLIGQLVVNELAADFQSKEVIRLTPGAVGTYDPNRSNYTWNGLIRTACAWCGLGASNEG